MKHTALLLIDVQNDYFPGGAFPLPDADRAGMNAGRLLTGFRQRELPVIHVQHLTIQDGKGFFLPGTDGARIHKYVAPLDNEAVVVKHRPNSFLETDLEQTLRNLNVERLVVCGMMTNMCVDAGVRAAADRGYECVLVHDACAAADLAFNGVEVPAKQVHAAFVAALGFAYAQVVSCEQYLASLPN